jgi:hypothetical protein
VENHLRIGNRKKKKHKEALRHSEVTTHQRKTAWNFSTTNQASKVPESHSCGQAATPRAFLVDPELTVARSSPVLMSTLWYSMQTSQKGMSKSRRTVLAACICTCLSFLLFWNISSIDIALPGVIPKAVLPSCKHLAEDHETLFILRTGATEIADRIPAHIPTSLHCTPHVIFSDHAESFLGERVIDALELVDPDIVANNRDFELYRRVKQHGRAVLSPSELSGNRSQAPPSGTGNVEIAGWKLDKWKFVPMVNRTLYEYPYMKWYVFAEGDISVLW